MKDIKITKADDKSAIVVAASDKAKELLDADNVKHRFNCANEELYKILSWAISHNLTTDSEVSIKVPYKPIKRQGT